MTDNSRPLHGWLLDRLDPSSWRRTVKRRILRKLWKSQPQPLHQTTLNSAKRVSTLRYCITEAQRIEKSKKAENLRTVAKLNASDASLIFLEATINDRVMATFRIAWVIGYSRSCQIAPLWSIPFPAWVEHWLQMAIFRFHDSNSSLLQNLVAQYSPTGPNNGTLPVPELPDISLAPSMTKHPTQTYSSKVQGFHLN